MKRLLGFGFLMTAGSSFGQTYFLALMIAAMQADLGLSDGQLGSLYGLATVSSAVLLLWSGGLLDRLSLPRFVSGVTLVLAAGCAAMASAQGALMLLLGMLLLRHAGQGLMMLAGTTTVVRYLQTGQGTASAIAGSGYAAAEASLPLLVVVLLQTQGWRSTWWIWLATLLLVLLPMALWLLRGHRERHLAYLECLHSRDPVETQASAAQAPLRRRQWTRDEMLRDPFFYRVLPALLANPLLFTGFIFHQGALIREKGWSLEYWASLFLALALSGWICKFIAGWAIDRWSATRFLPFTLLPMALSFAVLGSANSPASGLAFMVLLGMGAGLYTTTAAPFYAEQYGTLHLGTIKSLTTSLMVFATAIAPLLMGLALDGGWALSQMAWLALAWIISSALLAAHACGKRVPT